MHYLDQEHTTRLAVPQGAEDDNDIRRRAPLEFALLCAANAEIYVRRGSRTATKAQKGAVERILSALQCARLSLSALEGGL